MVLKRASARDFVLDALGRRLARAALAVLCLLQAAPFARAVAGSARAASIQPVALFAPFPRLANYNGLSGPADVPAFQQDSLIIAPAHAGGGSASAVALLERANPSAAVLVYQRTLQVDYPLLQQMYGVSSIFPGWWLLKAGSVLTAPINATQTVIQVANPSRFHPFDDVLVDGESIHVLAIKGKALVVRRGFYSQATVHRAGAHIATHYSYRVDLANTIITGKKENRRPWSFNLSALCPRDARGRTWNGFLAARMAQVIRRGHWRGVFFDNMDEMLRDPWVDVNNDNVPDGGVVRGRNVWHDGEMDLIRRLHALVPGALIMYNGTLDAGIDANGREMEQFPLGTGLYMSAMSDYFYWERHDGKPSLDLVNPDSGRSPRPDLNTMRFGLASALMGNGFYSYDEGWHRHGVVWNFDEYDDGAGSAVLHDIAPRDTYIRVRDTFKFHIGETVLVGREEMKVRDLGSWNLIVQRGVNGTRATSHPAGSVIATPAQIARGIGYLGQPLGAPFPLQAPPRGPNLVANGAFTERTSHWYLWPPRSPAALFNYHVLATGPIRAGEGSRSPIAQRSGLPDGHGFQISVPWQPLRQPEAISLVQDGIAVRASGQYTLSFWARGTPGLSLPVVLAGVRDHGPPDYSTYPVTLHRGWYRYEVGYTAPAGVQQVRINFQFGHTFGASAVTGVTLQAGQSLVFARRFSHGLAVVNEGDDVQIVTLPRVYWHLRGDQQPDVDNGQPVRRLWLPGHSGMILLSAPPAP